MTVESTTNKVTRNGNDVATSFSFSFTIFASTDLVVTHVTAAGVETTLVEDTDYTVVVAEYPGSGSITYPVSGSALPTGESLVLKRVLPLEQTVDLENQGGYFPDTQETALDKLVMIALQQQEEIDRGIKLPVSYSGSIDGDTGTPTAGYHLRVNAAADALEWVALTRTDGDASDDAPEAVSLTAAAAGVSGEFSRKDHVHLLPTVSVAKGGTGATTASAARTALGVEIGADVQAYSADLDAVSGTNTGDEVAATTTVPGVVEKATQAEMQTLTADKYPDGALVSHNPGVPKLIVRLTGLASTPAASFLHNLLGALSVTDGGTGLYTLNWTNTLNTPRVTAQLLNATSGGFFTETSVPTSTSVVIRAFTSAGAAVDPTAIEVIVYGNLA